MKRILFFILIIMIVININVLFSQDNTSDGKYLKAIEFSIGGNLNLISSAGFFKDYNNIFRSGTFNLGLNIMVPISFIYYPNKTFGFGPTLGFGTTFLLNNYYGETIYNQAGVEFNSNLRLVNKIGNINSKKFLRIEYGIDMLVRFSFLQEDLFSRNFIAHLFIGPSIAIGFNKTNKIGFSYFIGGFFSTLLRYEDNNLNYGIPYLTYSDNQSWFVEFRFGVDFRWLYSYFKYK